MRNKIKDINFLPERLVKSRRKKNQRFILSLTGVLALFFMAGAVGVPFLIAGFYQSEIENVNFDIRRLDPAKPYYEEKRALEEDLRKKEFVLQDIKEKQQKITVLLAQINAILPSGCFVETLGVKAKEEFILKIVTNNPVETARVMVGLRQMNMFEKVELSDVGKVPFTNGPQPVEFKLKFKGTGSVNKA